MVATPNTAPKKPWERPRSRGGVGAPVPGRDEVADHGDSDDDQSSAAHTLERAKDDQLHHVLRDAAEGRAHEKHPDRYLQHDLAAVEIAEFSVERAGDRAGEQISRHHPRE